MVRVAIIIAISLSFLAPFPRGIYAAETNLKMARELFDKAEALYIENEVDLALRYYLAALDLFPSMAKAYYKLGIIYGTSKRQYERGIEFFHKSIRCDIQDPNPYHGLGITYCMAGNEDLGSEFLLKAAMMFLKRRNIRAALSIYDLLIQINEKDCTEKLARAIENHNSIEFLSLPPVGSPQ